MGRVWARADQPDDQETRKDMVTKAIERGIDDILVRKGDESFSALGRVNLHFRDGDVVESAWGVLRMASIDGPDTMQRIMDSAGEGSYIVSTGDWKVIPLENLVAAFQGSGSKLVAWADGLEEAKVFLHTLELGVDAVLLEPQDWDDDRIGSLISGDSSVGLQAVTVKDVRKIGQADRVCVDTCSIMVPGEGMLIGSQSACMLLVQSESEESGYVASRPFRVNAGAVHAYVMTPGGKTRYLSELKGGDEVMVVDKEGASRRAVVGRCKTERRPMLLIEMEHEGKSFNAVVQNAETVRLVGPDGSISVSHLKPGDRILAAVTEGGRHFGMSVDETIIET